MNARQLAARVAPAQKTPPRAPAAAPRPSPAPGGPSFADQLRQAQEPAPGAAPDVTLSAHAEKRVRQRGISMTAPEQRALAGAMDQLGAQGAQDAVLLRHDAAFVVNVPNRTVVTALGTGEMQQRAFTQIDSAMLL